jgi:hypothetical protein
MTGYDLTRFAFQGCFGIHVFKQTALKRDEEQIQAIVNHLSETMTDSFDIEDHLPCLMNISTGMHATKKYGNV